MKLLRLSGNPGLIKLTRGVPENSGICGVCVILMELCKENMDETFNHQGK